MIPSHIYNNKFKVLIRLGAGYLIVLPTEQLKYNKLKELLYKILRVDI